MLGKILKLLGYVKKKSNLTDEGRSKSIEMREIRAELNHAKSMMKMKQQINLLQSAIVEENGAKNTVEDQLLEGLMSGMFQKAENAVQNITPQQQTEGTTEQQPVQATEFSDDEIRNLLNQMPKKQLKLAKGLNDQTLAKVVASKFPALGQDTFNRMVTIYRSEYV